MDKMRTQSVDQAIEQGIIDGSRLHELRELDEGLSSFATELVEDFKLQWEAHLIAFAYDLHEANLAGIACLAHKLKSSTANIAARKVSRTCAELEKNARTTLSIDAIKQLIEKLDVNMAEFAEAFQLVRD